MKKQEKEKTQEVKLTPKQQELLKEVLQEKVELQKLVDEISKRELLISDLILDGAGIGSDEVESAELNQEQTTLTITKK